MRTAFRSPELFLCKVVTVIGGGYYTMEEWWTDSAGTAAKKIGGRFASTSNFAVSPTGATFAVGDFALARQADGAGGLNWELLPLGSGVAVEEVDGTPSYTGATTLRFDQADGFVLTNPSAGVVRVDMLPASATQYGVVSTTTQTFAGEKTFNDSVEFVSGWDYTGGGVFGAGGIGRLFTDSGQELLFYGEDSLGGNATGIIYPQPYGLGIVVETSLTANGYLLLTNNSVSACYAVQRGTTKIGVDGTLADGSTVAGGIVTGLGSGTISGTNTGDQLVFKTIVVAGQSDIVADSTTDILNIAAGTGITLTTNAATDTLTIAMTSVPNAFGTIVVSGQSDVVADFSSDTLVMVAGGGITITTNAASDEITFSTSSAMPGFTKYTKNYTDFADTTTTKTLSLFSAAAGSVVFHVVAKHSVQFVASPPTQCTLSVGVTGNTTQFANGLALYVAPSASGFITDSMSPYYTFAGIDVTVTITTSGGNTNTLTAGSVDIWVMYTALP